jgi:hypothetical protein
MVDWRGVALRVAVAAGVSAGAGGAASAMELRLAGSTLVLSGSLGWGAHHDFKAMVDGLPKGAVRVVALDSGGGSVEAAQEIGRRVRKEGWATLVDARRGRCSSACTAIFAAGSSRHYLGADGIADGVVDPRNARGLGYHEGGSADSRQPHRYSGGATAHMIALYYEFGSREAASIVTKAPPNMMYVISGRTALEKRIATSLSPP